MYLNIRSIVVSNLSASSCSLYAVVVCVVSSKSDHKSLLYVYIEQNHVVLDVPFIIIQIHYHPRSFQAHGSVNVLAGRFKYKYIYIVCIYNLLVCGQLGFRLLSGGSDGRGGRVCRGGRGSWVGGGGRCIITSIVGICEIGAVWFVI